MSQKYDLNVTLLLIQLLSQLTPKTKQHSEECCFSGGPDGTRTRDPVRDRHVF
jgi:hypothetical protein